MTRVSVLLPVYNAEKYLQQALDSLYSQTLTDFEIIAVDDASTDGSLAILNRNTDPRLKVLHNLKNSRISNSLNRAISSASGKYLARMDADDLSRPERFAKQVQFLDEHPEVDVVGSWYRLFGAVISHVMENPIRDEDIKAGLLFNSALGHPTVMMRASSISGLPLVYDSEFDRAEDFELWTRAASILNYSNIPEVLLDYRIHKSQTGSLSGVLQREIANRVRLRYLQKLGVSLSPASFEVHLKLANFKLGELKGTEFLSVDRYLGEMTWGLNENPSLRTTVRRALNRQLTDHYYRDLFSLRVRKFVREQGLLDTAQFSARVKLALAWISVKELLKRIKKGLMLHL